MLKSDISYLVYFSLFFTVSEKIYLNLIEFTMIYQEQTSKKPQDNSKYLFTLNMQLNGMTIIYATIAKVNDQL